MAGLLGLLDLGSGAINAQDAGVAVSGRNTANVNTEGYSVESVNLSAQVGGPLLSGVVAGDTTRATDNFLSTKEWMAAGDQGLSSTAATVTASLTQTITPQGQGLVQAYSSLFGSFNALAASPTDTPLRQQVTNNAQQLALSYQQMAASIAQSQAEADANIKAIAQSATALAQQIAKLNATISTHSDPTLLDQRDLAARQLAAMTGGHARVDPDGMMRVVVGSGQVLVDGAHAASLQTSVDSAYGNHLKISVVDGNHSADVTSALGGRLGAHVQLRDVTAANAAAALDQLAYDTATKINAVHSAGAALDGSTGHNLFAAPTQVAGAAAAMAVDPSVAANPALVAAGQVAGGSGDGSNALAISALNDQLLAGGNTATFTDQAISIVDNVGVAAKNATDQSTLDNSRVDVLAAARASVSGVSQQEELAKLAQFQHASEAAAKFVSVVNDLLGNLITNL